MKQRMNVNWPALRVIIAAVVVCVVVGLWLGSRGETPQSQGIDVVGYYQHGVDSRLSLLEDGTFRLNFPPYSNLIGGGSYETDSDKLILKTDCGDSAYVFRIVEGGLIYLADQSSQDAWSSGIKDGALFARMEEVPSEPINSEPDTSGNEPSQAPKNDSQGTSDTLPLKESTEFMFASGAGGWSTLLWLNPDGSFEAYYHDSDMGTTGEAYPKGTVYLRSFRGQFGEFRPLNEYSWSMRPEEITLDGEEGEEWIEDGVRYVISVPYGMEKGEDYILYLPGTPIRALTEDCFSWSPYRYYSDEEMPEVTDAWCVYNVEMGYGFFS